MSGFELVDRINHILQIKNISKNEFYKNCQLPNNACTKWSAGSYPNSLTLSIVATYLDVSMDYLMTGKESEVSVDDIQFLKDFHSLDKKFQELIKLNISKLKEIKIDNSI